MPLLLVLGLALLAASVYLVAEVATAGARQRTMAVQRASRYGQHRRAEYGSAPLATASGSGSSGDSWERSCSQAKNRKYARRRNVR